MLKLEAEHAASRQSRRFKWARPREGTALKRSVKDHVEVIIKAGKQAGEGKPLTVSYRVNNISRSDVYIVRDRCFFCVEREVALDACTTPRSTVNICLGELPLPRGVDEYCFVIPELKALAPGKIMRGRVLLELPLMSQETNPDGDLDNIEIPLPSTLDLVAIVGYFTTPFKPRWSDTKMRDTFLARQRTARSNQVEILRRGSY
jgi:hypothetical protein